MFALLAHGGRGTAGVLMPLLHRRRMIEAHSSASSVSRSPGAPIGYALWLLYGIALRDVPLMVVDATGLAAQLARETVALRLRT
jgi:hypothetical protein